MPDDASPGRDLRALTLLALLLGCGLRLTGLAVHSLWYDEGGTMFVALSPDLVEVLRADRHPPLSFLAFRNWAAWGGRSDAWLRLLPALLSCLSLVLFSRLSRLLLQPPAALIALAVFAFSPFHIWHGQEVRMYTFVEFGAVLTFVGVLSRRQGLAVAACAVGVFISVGSHYMGALVVPAAVGLAFWSSWREPHPRARPGARCLALFGGAALWIPWMRRVLSDQLATTWAHQMHADARELIELPIRLILIELDVLEPNLVAVGYAAGGAILLSIAVALVSAVRTPRGGSAGAALLALLPILAALILAAVVSPNFTPKYLIAASPGVALLVGAGIAGARSRWLRWGLGATVLASCLLLALLQRQANHREDFRQACADLESAWRAGDRVLVITGTPAPFSDATVRHYLRDRDEILRAISPWEALEDSSARDRRLHVVYRSARYAEAELRHLQDTRRLLAESPERLRIQWLLFAAQGARPQPGDEPQDESDAKEHE